MKLRNDHILIFGGASGIGMGIAKKLLAEGATITIAGRNTEKLKQAIAEMASDKAHYITADITHLAEHDAFFEAAEKKMGRLTAFVNTAGIYVRPGEYEPWDITEEEWDRASDIDFKAAFFLMRNEINYLKSRGIRGNILNIASNAAFVPIFGLYGTAKLAVVEWTKGLGRLYGHDGIIINAIAPGSTVTPMIAHYASEGMAYPRHAIDRFITVEEQGELAYFMMSDVGEITAAGTIVSDGGDKGHFLVNDDGKGYAYKNV